MPNAFIEIFNSGASGLTGAGGFGSWFPLTAAKDVNFNIQGDLDLTGAGGDVLTLWIESSHENPDSGADSKRYRPVYTINPADGVRSATLATILGNVTRSSNTLSPSTLQASRYTAESLLNRFIRIAWTVSGTAASFKSVKVSVAYESVT
jgi:hypothetical protein